MTDWTSTRSSITRAKRRGGDCGREGGGCQTPGVEAVGRRRSQTRAGPAGEGAGGGGGGGPAGGRWLAPGRPRCEPGPGPGGVEDEVGVGDRQPCPARTVGVDAPGLKSPRFEWHADDDPPAVVRPVGGPVPL